MEAVLLGSGWHPSLFRAEMDALGCASSWRLGTRTLIIETDNELVSRLTRSACIDECLSPFGLTSEINSIDLSLEAWLSTEPFGPPEGRSIAVRWSKMGGGMSGIDGRRLAMVCGGQLSDQGWAVDLETPDEEFLICADGTSEHIIWGLRMLRTTPRSGWKDRVPTERPFFKPVSLDPRLARLALNLVDKGADAPICDPMCGTGGVMMEATLLGIPIVGVDLDAEMIEGSRTNLDWLESSGADVSVSTLLTGDATQLPSLLSSENIEVSGFVFDPPYGRNAWKSDDAWTLFTSVLSACRESSGIERGSQLVCFLPWPPGLHDIEEQVVDSRGSVHGLEWENVKQIFNENGWNILSRHAIPVHGSLARLLVHTQAS